MDAILTGKFIDLSKFKKPEQPHYKCDCCGSLRPVSEFDSIDIDWGFALCFNCAEQDDGNNLFDLLERD